MAPTPSPILAHSSSPSSTRYLHLLRRQGLSISHHPPGQTKPRALDVERQPPAVLEGPPPPPIGPTPSESVALTPESSVTPVKNNQPQELNQQDVPGNIVAAVVVVVLILGGLIGLVVGGEMLRRRTRTTGEGVSRGTPSRCSGRRKSKPAKNAVGSTQKRIQTNREKSPYDEKTLNLVSRPPPVLNREHQRRLSEIWPVRSLSRAVCNRRPGPEQVEHNVRRSLAAASPQTTWSDFSSASLYVAPPRIALSCIPEETEDCQSQTDIEVILGVTLQRASEPGVVVSIPQTTQSRSAHSMRPEGFSGPDSSLITEGYGAQDYQNIDRARTRDEDTKSLGSTAPDMTADGGGSSRSSMASLENLEDGNDKESLGEEVFELRRAQTRSMQMNKGVLLSLGLKTLDDNQNVGASHGELGSGPSRSPSTTPTEAGKGYVEAEMSLAMLGGSFSAVNLDEFPSPPSSILPVIPSFVSGF